MASELSWSGSSRPKCNHHVQRKPFSGGFPLGDLNITLARSIDFMGNMRSISCLGVRKFDWRCAVRNWLMVVNPVSTCSEAREVIAETTRHLPFCVLKRGQKTGRDRNTIPMCDPNPRPLSDEMRFRLGPFPESPQ